MTGSFTRLAIERLIDQAAELGVDVPGRLVELARGEHSASGGAFAYVAFLAGAEPPIEATMCCIGTSMSGDPSRCTCWVPVYEHEQATPRPPTTPGDLEVSGGMCGDCAFRHGSPEKSEPYLAETLQHLADTGEPFWCHQGMRRPVRWVHPTLGSVPGDPADWHPIQLGPVPFRADGRPALLCAGWAHAGRRATAHRQEAS